MNENEAAAIARLKERFGTVKRAANGWVRIACPTCLPKDRKKFKRYVRPDSLYNLCYICNMPMQQDELVGSTFIKISHPQQVGWTEEPKKEHPWAKKLPGHRFIPVNQLPLDHPAIKFLHKDFLYDLDSYYNDYGMVYCPSDAGITFCSRPFVSSADRLVFPVKFRGELVGWQMRSIPGTTYGDRSDVVKYYHLFHKGSVLFNYDKAKSYDNVVLVEGVKKALKRPNAVACFGKDITEEQVQMLAGWPKIAICLDAQDVAQTIALRVRDQLKNNNNQVININLANYGFPSPDEMTTDQFNEVLYHEWKCYEGRHGLGNGGSRSQDQAGPTPNPVEGNRQGQGIPGHLGVL